MPWVINAEVLWKHHTRSHQNVYHCSSSNWQYPRALNTVNAYTLDMHIAIFDYAANFVYVSNASPYINGQYIPAYDRQFIRLDMTKLFNQTL
jgi:hypothetical protein